ncbi:DUF4178 domain-containing protein [Ralstonia pseudosolanacearum]|uniref:Putative transmembrane protein n=1 Tax=Ralstonia solanacearum TaxID=305 RepID=A0A0S4X0Y8_RALSL|nr:MULTISPECIES: DUF4178 domain-containing protein [Ralstonia]MBX9431560.1 DUF4178 domain-containing protein [Ralstonia pseudosolanacearum]MCF1441301.1 DUF4178 domain-containing protein [Ralstonia solanacearum]QWQ14641.1 DUF4178 domain-containing protein [Ralstonia solanacearum]CUV57128.1 putative transmembrane protein [Ralstonia solanacearum]
MFHANCPACGAPVELKSAAAVMAVCSFCKSTLLRDGETLKDIGKMSAVLEDYARVQIGTTGRYQGRAFTVIGRIQLRYDAGFWNEWYALFDDGSDGWLAEASGQVTMTLASGRPADAVPFESLRPGQSYDADGKRFVLSDVREADCTGGEGELPFRVGQGWRARVADGRSKDAFLTLDYSDGTAPVLYLGVATSLKALNCQLLRSDQDIRDSAGALPGKLVNLDCPACGTSVPFSPGVTTHLLCPSCGSAVDTSAARAELVERARSVPEVVTTLDLGAKAVIDGAQWQIIGVMRRTVVNGDGEWFEYLLYSASRGFLWLVETDEGWSRARVLERWPETVDAGGAVLDGKRYARSDDYSARVSYAAGAFNWRVKSGDVTRVIEYGAAANGLAAESDAHELNWSRSTPVSSAEIQAWFGKTVAEPVKPADGSYMTVAVVACVLLGLLNLVPFFMAPGAVVVITLFAAGLLLLPAWLAVKVGGGE